MQALDRLSTIEHALSRKRAALNALTRRANVKGGNILPTRAPPSSDAARLAILQHECESLERSREEELLTLASSETRHERIAGHASGAELPLQVTPPKKVVAVKMQSASAEKIEVTMEKAASAQWAWRAYRDAQRKRDNALRDSLKSSWRHHDSEIEQIREQAVARTDSGLGTHEPVPVPRHSPPYAGAAKAAKEYGAAKAEAARRDAAISNTRRETAVLSQELLYQRQREWSAREGHLRQIRAHTAKRVDDQLGPAALAAKPLRQLTTAKSLPAAKAHVVRPHEDLGYHFRPELFADEEEALLDISEQVARGQPPAVAGKVMAPPPPPGVPRRAVPLAAGAWKAYDPGPAPSYDPPSDAYGPSAEYDPAGYDPAEVGVIGDEVLNTDPIYAYNEGPGFDGGGYDDERIVGYRQPKDKHSPVRRVQLAATVGPTVGPRGSGRPATGRGARLRSACLR